MLTLATVSPTARPIGPADPAHEVLRLRELLIINRLLVQTSDSDALLRLLVDKAAGLVEADGCVLLVAGSGGAAIAAAALGVPPDREAFTADLDEQLDVALHRFFAGGEGDVIIAVPIVAQGVIDGVLAAYWRAPRGPRPDDEFLLSALTDLSAMALAQAMSYQRMYQAERAARETAERAVRVRDELLAMVSHDLRNPLSTISMSALLLLADLPRNETAPMHKHAQRIQRSVDQMLRLVDDLLDVAKLEAGTLSIERHPHDAVALARDALDICHLAAQEKSLSLHLAAPTEVLPIACDRERVLQVLANLIGNAIKFTPMRGRIEVAVSRQGDEVVFSVKDTGRGIPPEQLERVFDRYWQAERRSQQGSGLGLFIARSLVQAHGGRIWAESEVGVGSVFSFALSAL